jgi:2-desacetyl-2-hydroxyethyl bacteriochlorophyllide A dehydrogenase
MENPAAILIAPGKINVEELVLPPLQDDWVLVQTAAVGICGTDLGLFDGSNEYLQMGRISYPIVPGHEFCGTVVEIGKAVKQVQVGDKVTSEIHIGCGACRECRSGRYNLCKAMRRLGIGDISGAMARYLNVPQRFIHKLPSDLTIEQGILIEPLSVALYALDRAGIKTGDKVLIFGPGPIGLIICHLARWAGAAEIGVVGRPNDFERLNMALKFGANFSYTSEEELLQSNLTEWADIVFEVTGHAEIVPRIMNFVRKGGTLGLVGLYPKLCDHLDLNQIVAQEKKVIGGLGSPGVWERSIALLKGNRIELNPLISHRFDITKADIAFDTAYRRGGNVMKVMVTFS